MKVLESDSVIRREAVTGLCLEALLGEKFRWGFDYTQFNVTEM